MIPVRRWPLFVLLVLCVKAGPWAPFLRWVVAPTALFDVVMCGLLGRWWWAVVFAVLAVAVVACSFPMQRASAQLREGLLEIRREGGGGQ